MDIYRLLSSPPASQLLFLGQRRSDLTRNPLSPCGNVRSQQLLGLPFWYCDMNGKMATSLSVFRFYSSEVSSPSSTVFAGLDGWDEMVGHLVTRQLLGFLSYLTNQVWKMIIIPNRTYEHNFLYSLKPPPRPWPHRQRRRRQRKQCVRQQQRDPPRRRQQHPRQPQPNRGRVQKRHPGQPELSLQDKQLTDRGRLPPLRLKTCLAYSMIHDPNYYPTLQICIQSFKRDTPKYNKKGGPTGQLILHLTVHHILYSQAPAQWPCCSRDLSLSILESMSLSISLSSFDRQNIFCFLLLRDCLTWLRILSFLPSTEGSSAVSSCTVLNLLALAGLLSFPSFSPSAQRLFLFYSSLCCCCANNSSLWSYLEQILSKILLFFYHLDTSCCLITPSCLWRRFSSSQCFFSRKYPLCLALSRLSFLMKSRALFLSTSSYGSPFSNLWWFWDELLVGLCYSLLRMWSVSLTEKALNCWLL